MQLHLPVGIWRCSPQTPLEWTPRRLSKLVDYLSSARPGRANGRLSQSGLCLVAFAVRLPIVGQRGAGIVPVSFFPLREPLLSASLGSLVRDNSDVVFLHPFEAFSHN